MRELIVLILLDSFVNDNADHAKLLTAALITTEKKMNTYCLKSFHCVLVSQPD